MGKNVVILGGGVAGLSAAHELIARGFRVRVYDSHAEPGGKARSQYLLHTGTGGRRNLPGEHGFRFYPAFYKHLIRTMEEIPLDPARQGRRSVADNLVPCSEAGMAAADGGGLRRFLRQRPTSVFDLAGTLEMYFKHMDVSTLDVGRFGKRILRYFAACPARRLQQFEKISWWKYLEGERYDRRFQRYLRSVPRIMVAMDPEAGSARSLGNISMQLLWDYGRDGTVNDRTLVGPTTEAWLSPWQQHLEKQGVQFHFGKGLVGFDFDARAGVITGARIDGEAHPVRADHYIAAMPLEAAVHFVTDEMASFDEVSKLRVIQERGLVDAAGIVRLGETKMVDWMVGIQLFLREDVPMLRGHVFYPDSPWALSSISQAQFWALSGEGRFRTRYGDGTIGGVLSVDVSDWNREGTFVKKPAKRCSPAEILREVWEQIKAGVNREGEPVLTDDLLDERYNLDQDIVYSEDAPTAPVNRAPLLVHPPDTWRLRPTAETGIENLVLASDYVQTGTILACMEGANEAARLAVNSILRKEGHGGEPAALWPLREDPMFDKAKRVDEIALAVSHGDAQVQIERLWEDDPSKPFELDDVRRLQHTLVSLPEQA
jgi:15-cis-phytoene desaturase